jgi:hypothetical protein
MKLTAIQIKAAKPKNKPYKLMDGSGLYLLINKAGCKYWRYNYRFMKKHKTLSIGVFPEVSLKEARGLHYQARQLLSGGVDPAQQRKLDKAIKVEQAENTFGAIAQEWLDKKRPIWAKATIRSTESRLNNHILEYIGKRPIVEITAPEGGCD